ncbi:T6SS phospholipase effector Tle1-like catalytic domain-containing protein [Bradyrhizobium pachyrhizi]|uniref:T6SS phospholipase effector Tle1-like catalytic domain-containing protein n=1 Tax=Bradyrhizobium pachyrhizi TaxID=280333 RepID=UPI003D15F86E
MRPEQRVSNVYKMYRASRTSPDNPIDPHEQVAFYDPGLGTDIGATALTAPWRFIQKCSVRLLAMTSLETSPIAIPSSSTNTNPVIFLVGFSRGAYTVRSLANLLMLCGVPTRTPTGPLMRFRK